MAGVERVVPLDERSGIEPTAWFPQRECVCWVVVAVTEDVFVVVWTSDEDTRLNLHRLDASERATPFYVIHFRATRPDTERRPPWRDPAPTHVRRRGRGSES